MASAVFSIKDTKEARTELALLLQIDPSTLDNISQAGQLTVDFENLAEDMALQVLSRAVSNHGFTVSIGKRMAQPGLVKDAQVEWPAPLEIAKEISRREPRVNSPSTKPKVESSSKEITK